LCAGHYLGGDVHDTASIGHDKPFQPGVVLAVEPALYIPNDPEKYRALAGIAIRLEDDVLVTEQGPVILSKDVPLDIGEIEDLVGTAADIAQHGL
jgi:Xaa-Pro aminopeptidase